LLGTILTEDNDITIEIKERIVMANNVNCVVLVVNCAFLVVNCVVLVVNCAVLVVNCAVLVVLLIVLFYVLFVCKCVLYYCHRVSIQLQLANISKLATSSRNIYTRRI
jgi:hypothetical protein